MIQFQRLVITLMNTEGFCCDIVVELFPEGNGVGGLKQVPRVER